MASLAGSFLVSRPSLQDPFFKQAVILLLQHGPEGAFGLILNKPTTNKDLPFPVFVGGPCRFEGFLLLHGHREWLDENNREKSVAPGVYLGDANSMEHVTDSKLTANLQFRIFAGYSGWAANQLENELGHGSWSVVHASSEHVFKTSPDELWEKLAPPTIPEPSLN